jgi:hypothetical protein
MDHDSTDTNNSGCETKQRRGRPCAVDRLRNEIMQQKLTHMINSNQVPSNEFAKLNILPFIVKRQRRVRANDRERNRMQSLNGALRVLRQHLPVELLMQNTPDLECNRPPPVKSSNGKKSSRKKAGNNSETKVTKIDTLRMATKYIAMLDDMLRGGDGSGCSEEHNDDAESIIVDSVASSSLTTTAHSKTSSSASVNSYESDSPQSPPLDLHPSTVSSYFQHEFNNGRSQAVVDINANYYSAIDSNYCPTVNETTPAVNAVNYYQASYFSTANFQNQQHHPQPVYLKSEPLVANGYHYSTPGLASQHFYTPYSSSNNGYSQFLRSGCLKYD